LLRRRGGHVGDVCAGRDGPGAIVALVRRVCARYSDAADRGTERSDARCAAGGRATVRRTSPKCQRETASSLAGTSGWQENRKLMNLDREYQLLLTRRQLFGRAAAGVGTVALASLLNDRLFAKTAATHFAAKAKRVIYLFMSGGPSHIDLFDYKPRLKDYHGTELPASVRMGQRVTGMTAGQKSFPGR